MNDPAVLFYTSDFLTGVIDMTMEERGQYITLLCYQHQKGHIPIETIRLLVGYSVSDKVMQHFKIDKDGNYYNSRMDIEKEKRAVFTESRRINGQKGGRPKKEKNKPLGKPKKNLVDNHMGNHMGNENDNENININKKYFNNDEVNELFKDFLDLRKKIKAVNSDRAINNLINKLNKYDDDIKKQMINNSITNSWKDVYEIKKSVDKKNEVLYEIN